MRLALHQDRPASRESARSPAQSPTESIRYARLLPKFGLTLRHPPYAICRIGSSRSCGYPAVMGSVELENTVKHLCAEAVAQRDDRHKLKSVLIQLREFLQEHTDLLRSMSDDTFDALRKVWH